MRWPSTRPVVALLGSLVWCGPFSCRQTPPSPATSDGGGARSTAAHAPAAASSSNDKVVLDLLEPSPRCRVIHRGALIDLGGRETVWSTPGRPSGSEQPTFDRDGATWSRAVDRTQSFTVVLDEGGPAVVSMRARARSSHKALATVDGKVIGTLVLHNSDAVANVSNASVILTPGLHTISLRWVGTARKEEAFAEVDWLRLGTADANASTFAAPTPSDVRGEAVIADEPRRGFLLRSPSTLRCVAWLPRNARLVTEVGLVGDTSPAQLELRVRDPVGNTAAPPAESRVLSSASVRRDRWTKLDVPIERRSSGLTVLELTVHGGSHLSRVVLAEPKLVKPAEPHGGQAVDAGTSWAGDLVVVLVLAGLTPAQITSPTLARLVRSGTLFTGHRASSAYAGASVASLVTGLPVPVHALEDPSARLSPQTPLLPHWLLPFGVESAMFTEVPTTGAAFGFAREWTSFGARSPLDGPPVAIDELARWLRGSHGARRLAVIHARGVHPPWDIPPEVLRSIPPEGYSGPIEPRHAVTVIGKARRNLVKLTEPDVVRLLALQSEALATQERKLSALLDEMESQGRLDQTMFIVTGDTPYLVPAAAPRKEESTAAASSSGVPTGGAAPEGAASTASPGLAGGGSFDGDPSADPRVMPLIIRFAHGHARGRVVSTATDPTDVAATILASFGARGPSDVGTLGRDLSSLASDDEADGDTPHLVDDGHGYQLTWGDLRLVGSWGKLPSLKTRLGTEELRTLRPHEYLAAWALAAEAHVRWVAARSHGPGREPATIDSATAAALDSWERPR